MTLVLIRLMAQPFGEPAVRPQNLVHLPKKGYTANMDKIYSSTE
jgi:hypothetical protein